MKNKKDINSSGIVALINIIGTIIMAAMCAYIWFKVFNDFVCK